LPVKGAAQDLAAQVEPLIAMGEEVLAGGDGERAASIFGQILEMAPDNAEVISGLVRALVAAGRPEEAQALIDGLPEKVAADPAVARAKSALALAELAGPGSDTAALRGRVEAAPDDLEARFELAGALMAEDRDGAADQLLEIVRRDREWNDGAARKRLLQLMEVVGLEDPWAANQRRRLSAVLFT
jgi:putative thioredoxin